MEIHKVIALVDMDCFYVQVEQRCNPDFLGKPTAVVQYNPFRKGGIIAVSYEARAQGVKRGMMCDEALAICPDLNLVTVPCQRSKADLTKYRNASQEVFAVLSAFENVVVERASIDEAFLDLTQAVELELKEKIDFSLEDFPTSNLAVGNGTEFRDFVTSILKDDGTDRKLLAGAKIVEKIRRRILEETKFHCSAGISYNKMLSKLVCALHKPKQQTVLPRSLVAKLFEATPVQNIRMLGGKLGRRIIEEFSISTMAELSSISLSSLKENFGESTGIWLKNLSDGIDEDFVTPRQLSKSIGCSKNFPGRNSLKTKSEVNRWLSQLAEELEERLIADQLSNRRVAKILVLGLRTEGDSSTICCTRQTGLTSYSVSSLLNDANRLLKEFNTADKNSSEWKPHLVNLSLAAGKFEDSVDLGNMQITNFFKKTLPSSSINNFDNDESSIDKTPKKLCDLSSAVLAQKRSFSCDSASKSDSESFFKKIMKNQSSEKNLCKSDDEKTRDSSDVQCIGPSVKPMAELHQTALIDDVTPTTSSGRLVHQNTKNKEQISHAKNSHVSNTPKALDAQYAVFCPTNRDEIDADVWLNLTPQIRFELNNFYKRQEVDQKDQQKDSPVAFIENSVKKQKKEPSKNQATTKKRKIVGSRSGEKTVRNIGTTLLNFYDKL